MRRLLFSLIPPLLSAQAPAPLFEATASVIRPGQSVGLRWEVPGAGKVRLEPGGMIFDGRGQITVKPAGNTTYVLTAAQTGALLGRVAVQVDPAAVLGEPARICTFDASTKSVVPGEPVVLKWECVGDAKVRLEPGGLELDGKSEVVVTPLENTRYVLSVSNLAGGMTRALEVKVRPRSPLGDPAKVCSFKADRRVVRPGEPVELRWECQGEATVRLEPGGLELTGRDRLLVQPTANTVYTLNVSNLAGGMSRSLEILVDDRPDRPVPPKERPAVQAQALQHGDLEGAFRIGQARREDLLKKQPQAWTLRLVLSGHGPGVKQVARAAGKESGNLLVLPFVRRDGFRWWQACYGAFPSRAAALQAWNRQPETFRRAFPQPLPLKLGRLPGDAPKG